MGQKTSKSIPKEAQADLKITQDRPRGGNGFLDLNFESAASGTCPMGWTCTGSAQARRIGEADAAGAEGSMYFSIGHDSDVGSATSVTFVLPACTSRVSSGPSRARVPCAKDQGRRARGGLGSPARGEFSIAPRRKSPCRLGNCELLAVASHQGLHRMSINWVSVRRAYARSGFCIVVRPVLFTFEKSQCWPGN